MSNLLPKTHQEFSQKEYWESFFKKLKGRAFEWYGEYPELSKYLDKYIKNKDKILMIGCGNSTLGRDLYDVGYRNIKNIDISQTVIKQMQAQNKDRTGLEFIQMDALEMSCFQENTFNVIIDKGTLDALMPDTSIETQNKIDKYFKEIERVLNFSGRYICISLLQNHILQKILEYFPKNNFMFRVIRCYEAEQKALENSENTMPVFLVVCTKFKTLPRMILELNLSPNEKLQRVEKVEDVLEQITSIQQAAYVCSGLKNNSLGGSEVYFDLFEPGGLKPRFTVYIVDGSSGKRDLQYAAFIVPHGREAEWLFSTPKGRLHLLKLVEYRRLAIVTMYRHQEYGNYDSIKNELTDIVCTLAPAKLYNKKIPFLSLGSEVGYREIKYEGHSKISGDYVVEDVGVDEEKVRRLYYLNSQLVIQSEARLKLIKVRNKGYKLIVDLYYLSCQHHIYMSIAAKIACGNESNQNNRIVVIGLGGGGLCSFLHQLLPKTNITGVDIDEDMLKVAEKWFGFQQNTYLKAKIANGIDYLQELAKKGEKMNAVLFDVDCKDSSIGMSCPPKEFLEEEVINNVAKIVADSGLFVLNLVLRDETLRLTIFKNLKDKFKTIISFKLEDDLNEIIICTAKQETREEFAKIFRDAARDVQIFLKKNHSDCMGNLDLCYIFEKSINIVGCL